MYQYVYKICTIFVNVVHAQLLFGVLLYNLAPLYNSYNKGMFNKEMPEGKEFEHSINYSLPFIDQYTTLAGYIFIASANYLFCYDAAVCFVAFDLIISVIVFHIWGHLKILDNNLRSIPIPLEMRNQKSGQNGDELSYTDEENKKISAILKNIVDHHRLIVRLVHNYFFNAVKNAYRIPATPGKHCHLPSEKS